MWLGGTGIVWTLRPGRASASVTPRLVVGVDFDRNSMSSGYGAVSTGNRSVRSGGSPRGALRDPPSAWSEPEGAEASEAPYLRSSVLTRRAAMTSPTTVIETSTAMWPNAEASSVPVFAARTRATPWYSGLSWTIHPHSS